MWPTSILEKGMPTAQVQLLWKLTDALVPCARSPMFEICIWMSTINVPPKDICFGSETQSTYKSGRHIPVQPEANLA